MFSVVRSTAPFSGRSRAEAYEAWRDAAGLVAARWHLYLEAEPSRRAYAFAAYVAALDAEQAAADGLAGPRLAA
jgi:hypothetical protein